MFDDDRHDAHETGFMISPVQSLEQPVCVDLDGTLLKTDSLYESVIALSKSQPLLIFMLPFWLFRGRVALKRQLAERITLDVETLPYNAEVVAWLKEKQSQGHRLILATAADELIARKIARHCGCFSEVIGSDGKMNLKGKAKAAALVARFGEKGFVYAGNSHSDLDIWRHSSAAVVVGVSGKLLDHVQGAAPVQQQIPAVKVTVRSFIRAVRVHQWVKNLLVFVPMIAAHRTNDAAILTRAAIAFLAFCLCASGIYVLNDLLDLTADRKHAKKCRRPFAAGELPLQLGLLFSPILILAGFGLAAFLGVKFVGMLGLYFVLTDAYSLFIKTVALVDVMCLAGLYAIRIFAGGIATNTEVSHWLLAFSGFFFLSLALAKRSSELFQLRSTSRKNAMGRGYEVGDLEMLVSLGACSGYLSILVLALYINSSEVMVFYAYPKYLWLVCPLLLYWVSRVSLLTHRGLLHEDPVVFALKDKVSYAIGFLVVIIICLATGTR